MNHTFRTINRYHDQFEAYKKVITPKSFVFWISIFSVALFIYSFFWYMDRTLWPVWSLEKAHRLYVVMAFEIVVLACWFKLQRRRDKLVVESTKRLLNTNETDIVKLKKMWLETSLGTHCSKFLALAKDIDSMLELRERNKSPLEPDTQRLLNLLFTVESKNRILAMFMGVCAAFIGLSISAGASIEDVYSFYEEESITSFLLVIFVFSIFLMLSYLVFWYALLVLSTAIGSILERFDGLNSVSNRRARVFINQLIFHHELPKGRVSSP